MSNTNSKRLHLVLGGGGVRTISFLGAIKALVEDGYSFASISGCSAGSLVSALVCSGQKLDDIERKMLELHMERYEGRKRFGSPLAMFLRWPFSIHSSCDLPSIIRELIGNDPKIGELQIPFATTGVDLVSNEFVVYSKAAHSEMPVSKAVSIAMAIPFGYPPFQEDGRIVVDAAVATSCPVWLTALHDERLPVLALTCTRDHTADRPKSFFDYALRVLEAGVVSGDEYLMAALPNVQHVEVHCPKVDALDFKVSIETKRGLLDAGNRAIKKFRPGFSSFFDEPASENQENQHARRSFRGENNAGTIINYFFEREFNMNIKTRDNANINIGSTLTNVNQMIGRSNSLGDAQKSELEKMVTALKGELDKIKADHEAESTFIAQRLQEVVSHATQPKEKKNIGLLKLSSKGLIEAAKAVAEIAPGVLATANMIAEFILGLP